MNQTGRPGQKGATAVEFALILPLFVLLMFAVIDFGMYFFTQHTLQYATREGMRLALVGGRIEREDELQDRTNSMIITIREQASLALNPDNLNISIFEVNPDYSDPENWEDIQDAGQPGSYMRVRTRYHFSFLTPIIGAFFPDNKVWVQVQAVYRNEFFD
ncbi:TadE/TadG family type IV pilus assembly protein [Desulfonatronum lacustre]|uniref:TadE/TadG family type IV pilus assembly protein n=1 Tax=Desulfonatronum lacustre TaxID=66849 RepID=UPI0009FC2816|nr:TadE family protein [Desulfonatronum lacustre]